MKKTHNTVLYHSRELIYIALGQKNTSNYSCNMDESAPAGDMRDQPNDQMQGLDVF